MTATSCCKQQNMAQGFSYFVKVTNPPNGDLKKKYSLLELEVVTTSFLFQKDFSRSSIACLPAWFVF